MLKFSQASTQTKKYQLHFCKLVTLVSHFTAHKIILVRPFQLEDQVMTVLLSKQEERNLSVMEINTARMLHYATAKVRSEGFVLS